MDQSSFDKGGRRLSPENLFTITLILLLQCINKINDLGQNVLSFMAQVDEKLNELQSTFTGLVYTPSTSKARKRKQTKRKGIK